MADNCQNRDITFEISVENKTYEHRDQVIGAHWKVELPETPYSNQAEYL